MTNQKVVLITGASSGIGQATAHLLAAKGFTVFGTSRKPDTNVRPYRMLPLDVRSDTSVQTAVQSILDQTGRLDILINNAGVNKIDYVYDIVDEDWDRILTVNLTAAMKLVRHVAPKMMSEKKGHILNISSIFGGISKSKRNAYSASKAGLIGFTQASALDLAPYNILVNALCPGFTKTDLTQEVLGQQGMDDLSKQVPMGRMASPEEIAKTALFLVSNWNTYITGQEIIVDGGFVAQ